MPYVLDNASTSAGSGSCDETSSSLGEECRKTQEKRRLLQRYHREKDGVNQMNDFGNVVGVLMKKAESSTLGNKETVKAKFARLAHKAVETAVEAPCESRELIELLRSHGGVVSSGITGALLCDAAYRGDLDLLQKMRERGDDLDLGDYDCRTGLHLACCAGNLRVVEWLLREGGCDPKPRDRWDVTPVDEAKRYGHHEIVELLNGCLGAPVSRAGSKGGSESESH